MSSKTRIYLGTKKNVPFLLQTGTKSSLPRCSQCPGWRANQDSSVRATHGVTLSPCIIESGLEVSSKSLWARPLASKHVHIQSKQQQIWTTSLRPEQQHRWTIRTTKSFRSKINMIHIAFLPSFSSLFFSFLLKNRDLLVGEFLDVPTSRWQCSLILVL